MMLPAALCVLVDRKVELLRLHHLIMQPMRIQWWMMAQGPKRGSIERYLLMRCRH